MKVITFFSAKGGTGKTTFNMLLASYLKFVKGKKVMVLDLDAPGYNLTSTRERELDGMMQENPSFDAKTLYPVRKITDLTRANTKREVEELRDRYMFLLISLKNGSAVSYNLPAARCSGCTSMRTAVRGTWY